jgi:hypothetical protein
VNRAYILPSRCPGWSPHRPVAYVGLQPWFDSGREFYSVRAIEQVLDAMGHRRCRIEKVRRLLDRESASPEDTLRAALDAPSTPLLLEGWWPGPSGRHWAVHVHGPAGRLHASVLVPRLHVPRDRRRLLLTP